LLRPTDIIVTESENTVISCYYRTRLPTPLGSL